MEKQNKLLFIILAGIPCAGKSTWVEKNVARLSDDYASPVIVISRDIIRETLFGKSNIRYTDEQEKLVTSQVYKQLTHASMLENAVIIIDNTHTRASDIPSYFTTFKSLIDSGKAEVKVKFFDVSLLKARWRNYWRNFNTGKKIPLYVLKRMYENYIKIDQSKYKDHLFL